MRLFGNPGRLREKKLAQLIDAHQRYAETEHRLQALRLRGVDTREEEAELSELEIRLVSLDEVIQELTEELDQMPQEGKMPPRRKNPVRYQQNQAAAGTLLALGGIAAAVGILIWGSRRKQTPAAQPVPPVPGQPPLPPPPPPAVANCPLEPSKLDQWGQELGYAVFYFPQGAIYRGGFIDPTTLNSPQWTYLLQTLPSLTAPVAIVLGDGSFWTVTGVPPLPAPAPAARNDYCAWYDKIIGNA